MSEKKIYDFYNKEYPSKHELNCVKESPMLNRRTLAFFNKIKTANFDSLCDVGCSVGTILNTSKKRIRVRVGVDISRTLLKEAKRISPEIMVVQASATSLPFRDNSFELCTSFQVIEHVQDYKSALNELIRISKNRILISTDCWTKDNPTKNVEFGSDDVGHLYVFNVRELVDYLKRHSKIENIIYMGYINALFAVVSDIMPLNLSKIYERAFKSIDYDAPGIGVKLICKLEDNIAKYPFFLGVFNTIIECLFDLEKVYNR